MAPGLRACSRAARAMTVTGLCSANRSKMVSRTMVPPPWNFTISRCGDTLADASLQLQSPARETYGPWQTVYERFNRWTEGGTWGRLLEALHVRLDAGGKTDRGSFCADGSSVRASRAAAGASTADGTAAEPPDRALGRSRGGYGPKVHLVC